MDDFIYCLFTVRASYTEAASSLRCQNMRSLGIEKVSKET